MGKQFLCDYCLKGFPDNKSSREKHLRSNQHKNAYREYYVSCCNPQEVFAFLPGNVEICKKYEKLGKCEFGNKCKYSHYNNHYINQLKNERFAALQAKTVEEWLINHLTTKRVVGLHKEKLNHLQCKKVSVIETSNPLKSRTVSCTSTDFQHFIKNHNRVHLIFVY